MLERQAMAGNGNRSGITTRQRRAIAALLSTQTVERAAEQAKVGPRTLYRWMAEDAPFRAALTVAEGDAIGAATRRLVALQDGAVTTIAMVMADRTIAPATRLRAATAVLDYLLKLRELVDFETRLSALEAAANGTFGE